MNVSNKELLEINDSLVYLSNQKTCLWYIVSVNLIKIKKTVEDAIEFIKAMQDKYCSKDKEGNPIIIENQYQFSVEDRKSFDIDYDKWMKETNEIDFKISDQKEVLSESHVPALITPLIGTILILE